MIKIMADSTCDLSQEIIDEYDIGIAPLTINIEGIVYRDKIDIKPDEFYNVMENLTEEPTTSMPSPAEYLNVIDKAIADGYIEILCICMSSGTSAAYQSAEIAKDYFLENNPNTTIKIHVVDSKSMSHGSGWLILKSARLREQGATYEDLIQFNETYKTNVKHFLAVYDLGRLVKSGRISNVSAILGKILNLKPIMTMKNGRGAVVAKERGLKKVLNHYVNEFIKGNNEDITDFIIIGYTSEIKIAEDLKAKIISESDFLGEIFIMQMGVAVGTHVGLGGISMFYVEKGNKHNHLLMNEFNGFMEKRNDLLAKIKNNKN
ncbi:MAG: DegV family protein [Firmicutes bacterium HGW-Firmicutes-15]|nr:MAG: DegV family protein [Firmicutes bacterium HGW-Firmicutes-15]